MRFWVWNKNLQKMFFSIFLFFYFSIFLYSSAQSWRWFACVVLESLAAAVDYIHCWSWARSGFKHVTLRGDSSENSTETAEQRWVNHCCQGLGRLFRHFLKTNSAIWRENTSANNVLGSKLRSKCVFGSYFLTDTMHYLEKLCFIWNLGKIYLPKLKLKIFFCFFC